MPFRSDPPQREVLRGLRTIWLGACVLAVVGALALVLVCAALKLAPIAVRSGSMAPRLPVHTLLLVEQVPASNVRVGDVITFDPPGPPPRTTHRVVERSFRNGRWYFRTKGDANPRPDDWRIGQMHPAAYERGITYGTKPAVRVRWHIPFVGRIASITAHPALRATLVVLPLALLALNTLLVIWRPRRRPRGAMQVETRERDYEFDDDWLGGAA